MIGIARQLLERAKLWHWRRDQATSEPLRQWFRQHQRVDVGLYSYGCFDQWRMPGPLIIGRYCSIAKTVRSAPINHPFDAMTTHPALYERRFGVVDADIHYDDPQVIEDDVWIGHNAMILPSCRRVGRGSVIGAGAIVTKDVPRYSIVAGNPARLIRERFTPELQAALEESQWWTLDLAELRTLVREQPDLVMNPTVERVSAWTASKAAGK
ncbi:CatB-related O-acetyltransferase [Sphingomonas sp. FW199]|uniref:CatB-related O-acetyltransferase n=1 Tax=Sphingomonas sp. FW199 TaxID=3400217 RepID=UPI003CF8638F